MKQKITAGVLLLLLLAGVCIQPAYANSAQRHWRGTDGTGAVVTGESCPIVVDKELLTFDVQEFPEQYYPGYGQLPRLYRESHGRIYLPQSRRLYGHGYAGFPVR